MYVYREYVYRENYKCRDIYVEEDGISSDS